MNNGILSQSGHTSYGVKEFVVDTADDIEKLPIDVPMGSAALVIENGAVWMINSKHEWKEIMSSSTSSSDSSNSTTSLPLASSMTF